MSLSFNVCSTYCLFIHVFSDLCNMAVISEDITPVKMCIKERSLCILFKSVMKYDVKYQNRYIEDTNIKFMF